MTFQQALRDAEKTGCLFFRPTPHAHQGISRDILDSRFDRRLGHRVQNICALGTGHAMLSPRQFYWDERSRTFLGGMVITGRWHEGGGGIWLQVEDYCADDWITVPLAKWFLFDQSNVWNPLKIPHRWQPGGDLDWLAADSETT